MKRLIVGSLVSAALVALLLYSVDLRSLSQQLSHVSLPLLALAMKPLYWRPKRYYVEHLLFLIHNHAFVFLMLTILAALELIPVVGEHLGFVKFAAWLYIIWYIFRAMRNYYRQGWWLTFAKYLQMGLSYFSAAVLVLVLLAMYSAISLG